MVYFDILKTTDGTGPLAFLFTDNLVLAGLGCIFFVGAVVVCSAVLNYADQRKIRSYANYLQQRLNAILGGIGLGDEMRELPHAKDLPAEMVESYDTLLPAINSKIEKLQWTAHHDRLTGLLNGEGLRAAAGAILAEAQSHDGDGALLLCDVNAFLDISDRFGSRNADRLLLTLADRLNLASSSFRFAKMSAFAQGEDIAHREPIVARTNNDEFAIFLPPPISKQDAERFVQMTKRLFSQPLQMDAASLQADVSIGATLTGEHHHVYDHVLSAASAALFAAKRNKEDNICFFHSDMRNKAARILDREIELREALRENQFVLHYQPQLNLKTGIIDGGEALIRWMHPKRGLVMPGDFMPFAEDYGLINDIGNWVIKEAMKKGAAWHQLGHNLRISVNVSPKQLGAPELIPHVRACFKHFNLPCELFELEFTESSLMAPDDTLFERLLRLQKQGVSMALDDFGTGYSNLTQLLAAPLNRLKLDRSLLLDEGRKESKRLVILSAIRLARQLGVQVVCEGVETQEQLQFLERAKCHVAQGFFISKPVPEGKFIALVGAHNENSKNFLRALKGEAAPQMAAIEPASPAPLRIVNPINIQG